MAPALTATLTSRNDGLKVTLAGAPPRLPMVFPFGESLAPYMTKDLHFCPYLYVPGVEITAVCCCACFCTQLDAEPKDFMLPTEPLCLPVNALQSQQRAHLLTPRDIPRA